MSITCARRELLSYRSQVGVPWAIATSGRIESASSHVGLLAQART
jgi:hypothetical protein